jgi:gamma-glutamylcysteine synthetase
MDKETFNEYVTNRYQKQMDYYSKASAKNQKNYKKFQWILIILSALTPVFAALDGRTFTFRGEIYHLEIQMVVVIVSAIVAILTTGLKTFQYQEHWVVYRTTYEQLKPEIHYYSFNIGPYAAKGVDKEGMFVSRVETLLNKEHVQWPSAKKLQDDQGKAKTPEATESGNQEADLTPDDDAKKDE